MLVIFFLVLLVYKCEVCLFWECNKCDLLLHIGAHKNKAWLMCQLQLLLPHHEKNYTGSVCVSHPCPLRQCSDVDKVKNYHCGKRWAPAYCTWISLHFFFILGLFICIKRGEKNKISKPFQSWLTNLMWTYENKLIQGWDDSAYHTCSPSFDYNLWNLNEICSIQKNASISLVFCFQIKLHYIALFFLNYSCLVKGALL